MAGILIRPLWSSGLIVTGTVAGGVVIFEVTAVTAGVTGDVNVGAGPASPWFT